MKTSMLAAAAALFSAAPAAAFACACGCGVFDVGAESMLPTNSQSGATVWIRYNQMDQDQNWRGNAKAPGADNKDKDLKTFFYTVGGELMAGRNWVLTADIPISSRALTTTDDGGVFGPAGSIYTGHDDAVLGDIQLGVMYTGFSPDMSSGLGFGVKLPTGDYSGPKGPLGGPEFDRDTLPGSGGADLIVDGYHQGALDRTGALSYFVQARYQFAVAPRDGYRPGNEADAAVGLAYNLGQVGPLQKVAPVLQLLDSYRQHDSGANADPLNTGYERVLIAPGLDLRMGKVHLYADVAFPVYQHMNSAPNLDDGAAGQLAASALYTLRMAYDF
ncbi:MAG: hypothetical protein JO303_18275 [Caulobacteraceae bacterium]|nr:hypothetical protein [Caulobacteraceae bacterium]